ncbi:Predicted oxidoreductase [Ruaniaceae bacterium KH17]|nr:Predicted oxidoreductase [Ruaniaceae bacterium KH17]
MHESSLGTSGLRVSTLGLGTMTWGRDTDGDDAHTMLTDFVDAGGTVLDTAAGYADGASEELIGQMLSSAVAREDVVIVTKAGVRTWRSKRAQIDASRGTILTNLDSSLARLGTDHVDLLLVQAPDPGTPLEETANALEIAVSSGRARYVGLSNYPGWQLATLASLTKITATQVEYSLLERGAEREVFPAAKALGIGTLAWSALGRGVLTGKYRHSSPADSRAASAHLRSFVEPHMNERAFRIVESVARAADGLEAAPLDVALAWVTERVDCAIVGPRTPAQLRSILEANVDLPDVVGNALAEVSAPPIGYPER